MGKRGRHIRDNTLKFLLSRLAERELEAVSDCLYFSSVCENDYPELSVLFDGFGREHADNMKRIEKALLETKAECHLSVKANVNIVSDGDACTMVKNLAERESEDIILYEKLYLADKCGSFDAHLKEILRASRVRLSILENIQKT